MSNNNFKIDPNLPYRDDSYKRASALESLMGKAEKAAIRSHDAQTQVGAVVVCNKTNADLASGYNGFSRGVNDKKLPNVRPYKHLYMLHAEENLIANCARRGVRMDDCYVVCTMSPCLKCMRLLYQCGITRIVVKEKYKDFEDLKNLDDLEIIENITPEGYFELIYKVKE